MTERKLKLEDILAYAAKTARSAFNQKGEVAPMWAGHTATGELVMCIPENFNDGDAKQKAVDGVRKIFREKGVVQFAFMTEAWVLDTKTAGSDLAVKLALRSGRSLEHHPDRREVVMLQAEDKERCLIAYYYILRPEYGKPTLSPLIKTPEDITGLRGRMMGLLNDPVPIEPLPFTPLEKEVLAATQAIINSPETKAFFESVKDLPEPEQRERIEAWSREKAREARKAWEASKARD